jgi:hypothetical protein
VVAVGELIRRHELVPWKAPPPTMPVACVLTAAPCRHDALILFYYEMSGAPVLTASARPLVISCSFMHRWCDVIATARVHVGLPIRVMSPLVRSNGHVLATYAGAREVNVRVVIGPPKAIGTWAPIVIGR